MLEEKSLATLDAGNLLALRKVAEFVLIDMQMPRGLPNIHHFVIHVLSQPCFSGNVPVLRYRSSMTDSLANQTHENRIEP